MNLLSDQWLPVRLQDGTRTWIAPAEIAARDNPPVALESPRADFNGALAQFLIGLLQTTFAPTDDREWEERLETPPSVDELEVAFETRQATFFVDRGPHRFMQDAEPFTKGRKEIGSLLIDAPGDQTLRNNADHFVKRGSVEALCPRCAVTALLTLQLNAPSGGAGHRTSLRGGGPLTTLVALDPDGSRLEETLWRNLWLNVLPRGEPLTGNPALEDPQHIFPWLGPTRTSDKKGCDTTPEDAHPLQMYWAMPRRIRLDFDHTSEGPCDLCGQQAARLTHYHTLNYGVNYTGAWRHPLTPYQERKDAEPLPLHPQPGGISYRHWLGLAIRQPDGKQFVAPALVVSKFQRDRKLEEEQLRIWAFGYDMDNMKPRCWYEAQLPLYQLDPAIRPTFEKRVQAMVTAAEAVSKLVKKYVKEAWFKRPGDARGDAGYLADAFFQHTESDFYRLASRLIQAIPAEEDRPLLEEWHALLCRAALTLFERYAANELLAFGDPARVAIARNDLNKQLYGPKLKKQLAITRPKEKAA